MKRLDLILNGKGGVGKSFFAVNFIQFLKDQGITHVAIDSDNENSTLKRFHPETRFLDLGNRREMDAIFTALEKANLVVVDCRAASTDLFLDYFAEVDLPAVLKALGAALTLVMPVNHELDSVDQVQRLTEQLGKAAGYVVVRNAAHSDSFALFDSAEVRVRLKNDLGGKEITMTRLQDWLVEALNRENVTITAAAKHAAFIRAFYLSVILSQHFQQWSLLVANIDASLKPLSVIKTKVLKDAAPQLIALDRQQAQNDLEAVESSLTKENLQLLLVEQLKLTGVSVAVSAIQKEKYSPLFRSLALLVALDDLLSSKPDTAAHQKIAKTLFPEPGAAQKELVDTIPTQAWSDLKEAYRLATEIQALRQVLAKTLKSLSTVTQPQQLSLKFFLDAWNGQRLNRLEYFLAALSRLIEHGQLLPRAELELPSAFGNAVHGLRTRIRTLVDDVHRQLDQLNTRFQQLVIARYPDWAKNDQGTLADAPILTSQFIARCLKPNWDAQTEKAVLFIFDGMRYDIWDELLKPMLLDRLEILADLPGSSILPSETQLTRKAISAGLFPESFDKSVSEDRLLKPALAKEFGYQGDVKVVAPEGSGTGETVRYRAGNLDVYIFELCDKELHHIKTKKLPDGREVPTRPLSYVYEQNIKNIIDTEVMTVVRSLAPGTKVFVTADHGFGRVGREPLWFDDSSLNEREDCAYLNTWLRVPCSTTYLPKKVLDNVIPFTPGQLRLPLKETVKVQKTGQTYTKEYKGVVFPRVGYSFSRQGSHYNPDAYSHGGISIQELVIPMIVLRVRPKDEGLIALDQIEGPKEVLEGQEATFQLRLRRSAKQSLFEEELRVDVEIEIAAPRQPGAEPGESEASTTAPSPRQVCYVGTVGAQVPIAICHKPEEATTEERRAGSMQRVLTVTVSWREGARTARKSQTLAYTVQLNSERVVRRLGNLGSILGLAPKGIRS